MPTAIGQMIIAGTDLCGLTNVAAANLLDIRDLEFAHLLREEVDIEDTLVLLEQGDFFQQAAIIFAAIKIGFK